jgi:outer membrane protein
MKNVWKVLGILSVLAATTAHADFGYVDFSRVLQNSSRAKQEEKSLQALQKELEDQVTKVEKEITQLAERLQDPDYIDSLSQEAEQEQKARLRMMTEDRMRLIQQVTQRFQQAQQQILQTLGGMVAQASAEVAKTKRLNGVLNREAFFFADPAMDCTDAVTTLLDKQAK